jgi:YVTN family beta-propeller protein
MLNQGRILRLIALIFLNIIRLTLLVGVLNITFAQENPVLHQKTVYYLTEKHASSKQVAHISVGKDPSAIAVDPISHRVYVANEGDHTASVIDGLTNSNIRTIPVGNYPSAIGVEDLGGGHTKIYIASESGEKTGYIGILSVFDGENNNYIGNISVGYYPAAIGIYSIYFPLLRHMIYVPNAGLCCFNAGGKWHGVVSAVASDNTNHITKIPVGNDRRAIGFDYIYNRLYVANGGNRSVSVIDPLNNTRIGYIPAVGTDTRLGTSSALAVVNYDMSHIIHVPHYAPPIENICCQWLAYRLCN